MEKVACFPLRVRDEMERRQALDLQPPGVRRGDVTHHRESRVEGPERLRRPFELKQGDGLCEEEREVSRKEGDGAVQSRHNRRLFVMHVVRKVGATACARAETGSRQAAGPELKFGAYG